MDEHQDLLAWGETNNSDAPAPSLLTSSPRTPLAITLFDYQQEAVDAFKAWWDSPEQEALIALTVGLGKTITACTCVNHVLARKGKILWLTHREELIDQSSADLEEITGETCGIEKAEKKAGTQSRLVVASVQTLKGRRLEKLATWFKPDLIVCDEAHHALAQTWMAIKTTFYEAKVLNLTATPYRSDVSTRLNLGQVLIERNTTDGIKMGRLVPPKPVGKLEIDLGKVKKSLGDYEAESLAQMLCEPTILKSSLELLKKQIPQRRTIVFASTVGHGKLLSEALRNENIEVGEVYGDTPTDVRKTYFAKAKSTPGYVLVNNLCLTEGFNLPELDMVAIFRPTKNAALYLQMLGRGLRDSPSTGKKECLLIDVVDTAKRKTAEEGYVIPTDDDRKKYAAITGKAQSIGTTFFHWFLRKEEVEQAVVGSLTHANFSELTSGEQIYSIFFTKPQIGWRTYQQRVIAILNDVLSNPGQDKKDPTDFSKIFEAIRCGNTDAFINLAAKSGWRYYPHRKLPHTIEELEEEEAELEIKLEEEEKTSFNFQTLISEDAELKNFIIDIFGDEDDLGEQAKKYYSVFRIEDSPTVWFRPVRIKTSTQLNFHFIAVDKNTYWVRTDDGTFYTFRAGNGFISLAPTEKMSLSKVPQWNLSTRWANEPMTEKQAPRVAEILDIPAKELEDAHISRLSASAVMESDYKRRYLVKIGNWIAKNHRPAQESLPVS